MLATTAELTDVDLVEDAVLPSDTMLLNRIRGAIRNQFPFEGDLHLRLLWARGDTARFRSNWYREVEGNLRITRSLFVSVTDSPAGLIVTDETRN